MQDSPPALSIIIPTHNRPQKLRKTLEALFNSKWSYAPPQVEVVIVDDGSEPPIEVQLADIEAPPPYTLRFLRQSQQGPAAARNTGFKKSQGEIVLFLDDDIILLPSALERHYNFHTKASDQKAMLFGDCPSEQEFQILISENGLLDSRVETVPHVASGHISFRRSLFEGEELPYAEFLRTPVAEEYELSYRLHQRGIPTYRDCGIVGVHQVPPSTLSYICQREYRHGHALGELSCKLPEILRLTGIPPLVQKHHPYRPQLSLRWIAKAILAYTGTHKYLTKLFGRVPYRQNSALHKLLVGAHIMRGFMEGLRKWRRR
ncbi:MAG: glycosyltransferase [Bacteroidia bacterium]|nr:glycosyltransferase [Bacteroidia bacterium]MDW8133434.1 glycosyltransferase [Bacteroidia bacterium]